VKSVAPALPCVGCWLTGEDGDVAAGGENRLWLLKLRWSWEPLLREDRWK